MAERFDFKLEYTQAKSVTVGLGRFKSRFVLEQE
jgi:hypothetical protein